MARQKREGRSKVDISEAALEYLMTGENPSRDAGVIIDLKGQGGDRPLWEESRDELVRQFIKANPGRRPFAWWKFDSPGPRLRVGGRGDLIPARAKNLRFGLPLRFDFWDARFANAAKIAVPSAVQKELYDEKDPPRYESQATYLKRLKLLLPGEGKRIPKSAFEPEAAS